MTFEAPLVSRLHPNPRGLIDQNQFRAHLAANCTRGLQQPTIAKAHDTPAIIAAGGPSLANVMDEIAQRQNSGADVLTVNKASNFLIDRGIVPRYVALADGGPDLAKQFAVHTGCTYLIASLCNPAVFDALSECNVLIWHAQAKDPELGWVREYYPDPVVAVNGSGVVLRSIDLLYLLGYRTIDIFGFDGSYEGYHHAYEQAEDAEHPLTEADIQVSVRHNGNDHLFTTRGDYARQALETVDILRKYAVLAERGLLEPIDVRIHGDGLIPTYWRKSFGVI